MRSHPIPIPRGAIRPASARPRAALPEAHAHRDWAPLALIGIIAVPVSLLALVALGRLLGGEAAWPICSEVAGSCSFTPDGSMESAAAP